MVADAITGNISPEATTQTGNIFADATRGSGRKSQINDACAVPSARTCPGRGEDAVAGLQCRVLSLPFVNDADFRRHVVHDSSGNLLKLTPTLQGLKGFAEPQDICGAHHQSGCEDGQDHRVAVNDQVPALDTIWHGGRCEDQEYRPCDRYGAERTKKNIAVEFGQKVHVSLQ